MKEKVYVDRIILYCEKIERYMKDTLSYDAFITQEEKIDAVMLNLEQIGETAKKLSESYKAKHEDINWLSIIGLRNMISHEYEGIRLQIIYDIAVIHIPNLVHKLKGYL